MVMAASFGGSRKATRLTTSVCKAIGDWEKGRGMIKYAEIQFIAISKAIRVKRIVFSLESDMIKALLCLRISYVL